MTAPNFCSGCGGTLNPDAKFCPKCGRPVAELASPVSSTTSFPAAQPEAMPTSEQVVGVLAGATRRSGMLGLKMEPFVIVLTNRRIILAAQTTQMMKDNIRRAREQAEKEGKGFFGKFGAQLKANGGAHYSTMDPRQILAEQPGNYFYQAGQIESIRLREHSDDEGTTIYDFEIQSGGKKEKFQFNILDLNAVRNLVNHYYGNIAR